MPIEMIDVNLASLGPTESVGTCSRLGKNTPVVQRNLEQASRLISGGRPPLGGKRNIVLRPLDKPRTPALAPIDDGIRGHRLHTASTVSHSSPLPPLRNTQLPPLDTEQSSPPIHRASAQRGGKVAFSRGLGTAETSGESWHLPRTIGGADLRPNTTNTSRDPNSRQLLRKNSDHALHFPAVVMKVVGHAAGLTGVGGAFTGGMANTIVEDEEEGGGVGGVGGGGTAANSSHVCKFLLGVEFLLQMCAFPFPQCLSLSQVELNFEVILGDAGMVIGCVMCACMYICFKNFISSLIYNNLTHVQFVVG